MRVGLREVGGFATLSMSPSSLPLAAPSINALLRLNFCSSFRRSKLLTSDLTLYLLYRSFLHASSISIYSCARTWFCAVGIRCVLYPASPKPLCYYHPRDPYLAPIGLFATAPKSFPREFSRRRSRLSEFLRITLPRLTTADSLLPLPAFSNILPYYTAIEGHQSLTTIAKPTTTPWTIHITQKSLRSIFKTTTCPLHINTTATAWPWNSTNHT